MKHFLIVGIISFSSLSLCAQTKTKPKTVPARKPATAIAPASGTNLKNIADSASYALGVNIAQSLKKDIGDLNTTILVDAMKNTFAGKTPLMNDELLMNILKTYSEKVKEDESQAIVREGRAFLAKNKLTPGVQTTTSGLQYQVIKEGNGIKPTANDTVICNYKGTLINHTEFDNSYERGEPLTIPVGNTIKGWIEGLQLMPKGAIYKFFIPYELGYGLHGAGASIPGGSALIFEIELLDVKKG